MYAISEDIAINKFNKCGELFRSPLTNKKHYMFLSCIYCKSIFWELDNFLQHLDSAHHTLNNICLKFYKEDVIIEDNLSNPKKAPNMRTSQELASLSYENDPLEEKRFDYSQLLPEPVKIEKAESNECDIINIKNEVEVISKDQNITDNAFGCSENKSDINSDREYEPDKMSTEDEKEENTSEYEEHYQVNSEKDIQVDINMRLIEKNKKTSLKDLIKNRNFVTSIIKAYQKQNILWDRKRRLSTSEKQKAFQAILKDIHDNFNLSATLKQIKRIITHLKSRFMHYSRLRDKGDSYKPLWFFDLLAFLKPHLKENKMKSGVCKQLNDNQFLALIKLLKENECFWNENNIYHTSVINKREILKRITNDFSNICNFKDFNIDIMQTSIDEIIEMAREENANKLQHTKTNKNSNKYQYINKFYKEIEFLLPHVGPFKCKYCPKILTDVYAYKFHISRHDGTKPFKCMQCPRELTHKKEFVCHLRRHTKECPFQCNACEKSFPSQKEWHRHVVKHGSKPYVCELCADSFYTQHQLTNHMKNHNNIRDHVCPECGKGFTHRGLLRQHLQTHNKTKCFCSLCDNIYSNPRSLRKHYVRVHESGQQPSNASTAQYNCQICKITFSTIQDARQHRKEHKQSNPGERKHVCDICGHHFAYPRNLADHKKTHSNIRDQVCDVCGKAFTNANLLTQHKNVHTGEKFVCKACGKDYAHYRGLCRHVTKVHGTNIRDLDALLEKQKLESEPQ